LRKTHDEARRVEERVERRTGGKNRENSGTGIISRRVQEDGGANDRTPAKFAPEDVRIERNAMVDVSMMGIGDER
jgi:hypothetical protein